MAATPEDTTLVVSRIGGHVAVDLLNTVSWRLDPDRRREHLHSYPLLLQWARAVDVLTTAETATLEHDAAEHPAAAAEELSRLLALRENLYAALVDSKDPDLLTDTYRRVLATTSLTREDQTWAWLDNGLALSTPGDRLVRRAVDLLRDPLIIHFHQCHDVHCGWVYLDTSPRKDRRWCSSADCGNRNRARRHYAQRRNTTTS